MFQFQFGDEALDSLAFQTEIAADRATTADDGQSALLRISPRFRFGDVNERPNNYVFSVVGDQPRGHRLERPLEEQIEQNGLDEVVEMVAEGDLGRPNFPGDPIEHATPKPRTQRAGRLAVVQDVVHDSANRRVLDAAGPATVGTRVRHEVMPEIGVAGIDVDRD